MSSLVPDATTPLAGPATAAAPVEYGEATRRYVDAAALGPASRRVYRISLASWAWPLVGQQVPSGVARRRAVPPLVPFALLDDPGIPGKLAATLTTRAVATDTRTVNREVSALRSAVAWWREQRWLHADPTTGMRHLRHAAPPVPPLTADQVAALSHTATCLRDHAFWRVLYDTGASAGEVLTLDIGRLDLDHHRAQLRRAPGSVIWIRWSADTTQLLRWLTAGRVTGPVFLTSRRSPSGADPAHTCPITGRSRMSYRRAAEIFTATTRELDPSGKGWTLQQLRRANRLTRSRPASAGRSRT